MPHTTGESAETMSSVTPPSSKTGIATHASDWLRQYGLFVAVYTLVTIFTGPTYMGDTDHYADLIRVSVLSDFGHLLWILVGWVLSHMVQPFTSLDPRSSTMFTLITLSWFAGLLSVLLVYDLTRRIVKQSWAAGIVTLALIVTQGFLNFAQTGCSYTMGLAMAFLGLWLLIRAEDRPQPSSTSGVAAGFAFATAVGFWVPYVFCIPGLMLSTMVLFGLKRWRLYQLARMTLAFGSFCLILYGSACALQGIYDVESFKQWAVAPGLRTQISGLNRTIFGFARSFINMANDGVLFKRYLLHDPYNPVSLAELFRLSLGKFLFFYLSLGFWMTALLMSRAGRRFLAVLFACALPLMFFAVRWQGGDIERYMPLYPAIFLMLAGALSTGRLLVWSRVIAASWVIGAGCINGLAMAETKLHADQERAVARIKDIQPLWKPHSRIATVLIQDEIFRFATDYPFHPFSASGILAYDMQSQLPTAFDIVDRGGVDTPKWRQTFAKQALGVWSAGGDLWVTKRVLSPRPPSTELHWVEGDDPRVTWRDIYTTFSKLEAGRTVGGEDGFFVLPNSPHNRAVVAVLARP
jgi:hypothetical protein